MEQKYILYIILSFLLGFLLFDNKNNKKENFFENKTALDLGLNHSYCPAATYGAPKCPNNAPSCGPGYVNLSQTGIIPNSFRCTNPNKPFNTLESCPPNSLLSSDKTQCFCAPNYIASIDAKSCITEQTSPIDSPSTPVTSDSDNSESESDFDSEDSASPLDTDPPSVSTTPINFSRYTKIIGKSKSGKTIKRYNNNQLKCVKDCALNTQCVGIITNQSGTRCKTITDFSNPRRSLNIAYLKK
jgi:hypothetical protein